MEKHLYSHVMDIRWKIQNNVRICHYMELQFCIADIYGALWETSLIFKDAWTNNMPAGSMSQFFLFITLELKYHILKLKYTLAAQLQDIVYASI